MRRRFFVDRFEGDRARLLGEAAQHLGRVLRAEPGQLYELSDAERVRLARVERVARDIIEFALLEEIPVGKPDLRTTVLLAIVKFDHFEWAVEKATELGVTEIVPLSAERSEKALIAAAAKRVERWKKIALESAQQSRRLKPPVLTSPAKPADAFSKAAAGLKLLLSEEKTAASLRSVLSGRTAETIALAIGPEGGWTEREFESAASHGFLEASLGENILRTETAVAAALAVVNFALDVHAGRDTGGNEKA
jgi:16S rRNA (uracil1498-N3)-methyltransferase